MFLKIKTPRNQVAKAKSNLSFNPGNQNRKPLKQNADFTAQNDLKTGEIGLFFIEIREYIFLNKLNFGTIFQRFKVEVYSIFDKIV